MTNGKTLSAPTRTWTAHQRDKSCRAASHACRTALTPTIARVTRNGSFVSPLWLRTPLEAVANKSKDNLRYSSSYCMFGYPNNTGIDSGPCTTSEGCGNLASALEFGIKSPTNSTPYDYCDASGGAITSDDVQGCLGCVGADGNHNYLSNCTCITRLRLPDSSVLLILSTSPPHASRSMQVKARPRLHPNPQQYHLWQ